MPCPSCWCGEVGPEEEQPVRPPLEDDGTRGEDEAAAAAAAAGATGHTTMAPARPPTATSPPSAVTAQQTSGACASAALSDLYLVGGVATPALQTVSARPFGADPAPATEWATGTERQSTRASGTLEDCAWVATCWALAGQTQSE